MAGYAYLYLNEPDYLGTNITLRLAIAPVYLDSEVGFRHLLGPNTDLALGLAGGGYADDITSCTTANICGTSPFTGTWRRQASQCITCSIRATEFR